MRIRTQIVKARTKGFLERMKLPPIWPKLPTHVVIYTSPIYVNHPFLLLSSRNFSHTTYLGRQLAAITDAPSAPFPLSLGVSKLKCKSRLYLVDLYAAPMRHCQNSTEIESCICLNQIRSNIRSWNLRSVFQDQQPTWSTGPLTLNLIGLSAIL
jgi:hypothetical protein